MQVDINKITIGNRFRDINPSAVALLKDSISKVELLHPISITACSKLVAGAHRIEACKALGHTHIACSIVEDKELAEIDENLARADLTTDQKHELLATRVELLASRYRPKVAADYVDHQEKLRARSGLRRATSVDIKAKAQNDDEWQELAGDGREVVQRFKRVIDRKATAKAVKRVCEHTDRCESTVRLAMKKKRLLALMGTDPQTLKQSDSKTKMLKITSAITQKKIAISKKSDELATLTDSEFVSLQQHFEDLATLYGLLAELASKDGKRRAKLITQISNAEKRMLELSKQAA